MLESFVEDIGVKAEDFVKACQGHECQSNASIMVSNTVNLAFHLSVVWPGSLSRGREGPGDPTELLLAPMATPLIAYQHYTDFLGVRDKGGQEFPEEGAVALLSPPPPSSNPTAFLPVQLSKLEKGTHKPQTLIQQCFSSLWKTLFEQVEAAQDFEVFKRMMIKHNIELELQALRVMQARNGMVPDIMQPDKDTTVKYSEATVETEDERILQEILRWAEKRKSHKGW